MKTAPLPRTLCALIAGALLTSAQADELTAAKKADITKLLQINGTDRIVDPFAAIVTQGYIQSLGSCPGCSPKIPEVVRQETREVLKAHIAGEKGLIDRQVPVYHQHFSHPEIKQLITFYSSPVGRKMVAESNGLMRDSIKVSQEWGQSLGPEIRQRVDAALNKAGIKPPQPSSPPPSVLQPPPAK